jgi:hypothetical protein
MALTLKSGFWDMTVNIVFYQGSSEAYCKETEDLKTDF